MRFDLTKKMQYAHYCIMENALDIKTLREQLGWDQGQLANYLGVHRTSVSHFENGRVPSGPVKKLLLQLKEQQAAA